MDYTIQKGDTLGGLAKRYGTTTANLQALNTSITDPNKIYTGGVLKVPTSPATTGVTNTSVTDASKLGTVTMPVIPPPVNDTTASNNLATTVGTFTETSVNNQAQAQAEADRQAKTTPTAPVNELQGIIDKITSILGIQGTQGQVSQDIYAQEGVFEKKVQASKLENEAIAKERAYQKRAEEIRANPQGKLESGIAIDLANLDRQKNSELADIAIQYKVAQGAYADANAIAEAKVKMQFEPLENELRTLQQLFNMRQNDMSESEKMIAQAKIQEKADIANFARQKALLYEKAKIEAGSQGLTVDQFLSPTLADGTQDIVSEVSNLLKITKTDVPSAAPALGVISSLQKLATSNPDGVFVGAAPIKIAGKLKGDVSREKIIRNRGDIEAINLKVQQWASGASLTNEQIKQVKRLTPDKNDTDFAIKNKVNSLTSFMQQQVKSELASKGIDYQPSQVNYFDKKISSTNNDPLGIGIDVQVSTDNPLGI
jgi:LysM repeat protein